MSIPDQKFVKEILEPFELDIDVIVRDAFKDWREISKVILLTYGRSRAVIMHNRMIYRAQTIFPEKGIKIEEKYETAEFNVNDQLLFRFKKGDGPGLSRNYPTPRALAYHEHGIQNLLWPHMPRVEIVYILENLATEVSKIYVVGRDGINIAWKYSILSQIATFYQPMFPSLQQFSTESLVNPLFKEAQGNIEDKGKE